VDWFIQTGNQNDISGRVILCNFARAGEDMFGGRDYGRRLSVHSRRCHAAFVRISSSPYLLSRKEICRELFARVQSDASIRLSLSQKATRVFRSPFVQNSRQLNSMFLTSPQNADCSSWKLSKANLTTASEGRPGIPRSFVPNGSLGSICNCRRQKPGMETKLLIAVHLQKLEILINCWFARRTAKLNY
jgi:hypothetical protein